MHSVGNDSYDVASICRNGHVISGSVASSPQFNTKFCSKCGTPTLSKCPNCETNIRGYYRGGGISISPFLSPNFCHNCGSPYPWTELKLQSARDLIKEISILSDEDKSILTASLDDLVKDTPQTNLAATRFKKIMVKAGKESAESARQILIDIISETAKKLIWP